MIGPIKQHWLAWRNRLPVYQGFFAKWPLELSTDYRQASLLALDLEMTGLDPSKDQICSIGAVVIENGVVDMNSALAIDVAIDGTVGDSATIHGIRDCDLNQALSISEALERLLPMLEGRALLCHHAPLDVAFLKRALRHQYGKSLPLLAIDTLAIEHQRLQRSPNGGTEALDLDSCRRRYQLPSYHGHHALWDAIACAELFLAQARTMAGKHQLCLRSLV